jgi:hypothetical protein
MLRFAAPAGTASILIPSASDGLAIGTQLEHVGYGDTDSSTSNTGRRTGSAPLDQTLTATRFISSEGGASHVPGICLGDSGGPALVPAGMPQSAQTIVGVAASSDSATCNQNTLNIAMRVTSATGASGFITSFLTDAPIGTPASPSLSTCTSCLLQAQTGTCAAQLQACVNDPACITYAHCIETCSGATACNACRSAAGQTAIIEHDAYDGCQCFSACLSPCSSLCGPPPHDAGMPMPDAGSADAGAHDAGTVDAGTTDAGLRDAGTPDAGAHDAGAIDAGETVDSGAEDAGTTIRLPTGESGPAAHVGCSTAPWSFGWPIAVAARALRRRSRR